VVLKEVVLNVYDVGRSEQTQMINSMLSVLGTGAFHVGLEIFGKEWSFRGSQRCLTGVFACAPRRCPGHRYRESLSMGYTRMGEQEASRLLASLEQEWKANTYDVMRRNCVHFCDMLCLTLGVAPVPRRLLALAASAAALDDGLKVFGVRSPIDKGASPKQDTGRISPPRSQGAGEPQMLPSREWLPAGISSSGSSAVHAAMEAVKGWASPGPPPPVRSPGGQQAEAMQQQSNLVHRSAAAAVAARSPQGAPRQALTVSRVRTQPRPSPPAAGATAIGSLNSPRGGREPSPPRWFAFLTANEVAQKVVNEHQQQHHQQHQQQRQQLAAARPPLVESQRQPLPQWWWVSGTPTAPHPTEPPGPSRPRSPRRQATGPVDPTCALRGDPGGGASSSIFAPFSLSRERTDPF